MAVCIIVPDLGGAFVPTIGRRPPQGLQAVDELGKLHAAIAWQAKQVPLHVRRIEHELVLDEAGRNREALRRVDDIHVRVRQGEVVGRSGYSVDNVIPE
jgi:hypothetical protein